MIKDSLSPAFILHGLVWYTICNFWPLYQFSVNWTVMLASQEGPILKRLHIGRVSLTACRGFFFSFPRWCILGWECFQCWLSCQLWLVEECWKQRQQRKSYSWLLFFSFFFELTWQLLKKKSHRVSEICFSTKPISISKTVYKLDEVNILIRLKGAKIIVTMFM